jgi:hypothetical protein
MKWNPGNAVVPCSPDPACRSNLGYWLKRERVLTGNARCGTGRRLPRARLLPVVIRLQTQPETRARTEKTGQSERRVRRDCPLTRTNRGNARLWHADGFRQPVLAQPKRNQELLPQQA